jgi:PleD family two-component response regulator
MCCCSPRATPRSTSSRASKRARTTTSSSRHEPELIARLNTGRRILALEHSLRVANEQNRVLSITDALTGTFNRRYLMEQLPRELERCRRYAYPLSVIMCDIDHFKQVNDVHGHAVGDEVLQQFARASRRASAARATGSRATAARNS